MIALSQILHTLFANQDITPSVTTVETALHPVPEKDIYLGAEFLDDLIRTDDPQEDNMNSQVSQ